MFSFEGTLILYRFIHMNTYHNIYADSGYLRRKWSVEIDLGVLYAFWEMMVWGINAWIEMLQESREFL